MASWKASCVFQWGECDQLHKMFQVQLSRGLKIDGFANVEVHSDLNKSSLGVCSGEKGQ